MGLFNRVNSAPAAGPSIDPEERIYAVGDIHGRLDLFKSLIGKIEDHAQSLPPVKSTHLVLLGDIVDRGPDSAALLDMVYAYQRQSDQIIVLKGNHEDLMLRTLEGEPGVMRTWMRSGGSATLRSYGIEPPRDSEQRQAATQALVKQVPQEVVAWLRELPLTARSGDYLFCHAGIRPGVPIKRQVSTDLLWIREDFLEDRSDHGVVVVHGHSVSAEVQVRRNRIGIDTGAYRTGVLTALYLEGTKRDVISIGTPKKPAQSSREPAEAQAAGSRGAH